MAMPFDEWKPKAIQAILRGDHSPSGVLGSASVLGPFIQDVVTGAGREGVKTDQSAQPRIVANWQLNLAKRRKVSDDPTFSDPVAEDILRFVRLIAHLGTAPWSSCRFAPNDEIMSRLIASHIKLITDVGDNGIHPRYYSLIDSTLARKGILMKSNNLVWVTNRQQGKTTTLGKFIAAITLAAKLPGGVLCCVYSTKLDRAAELLKAAKEYLHWMQNEGAHPEWKDITYITNNQNMFEVSCNGKPAQQVMARPKNPDTCRGDAFRTGIFDEAAFTSSQFWYTFALPLLQIRGRVFTCCTTPAPPRGFFDVFCKGVEASNARGETFFTLVNHSLSCKACQEAGDGARCSHRLFLIPPWKPALALGSISSLMPKNQRDSYAAEVYGVMASKYKCYIPSKLTRATFVNCDRIVESPLPKGYVPTVWIAIDPASHGVSDMGIAAIIGDKRGGIYLVGLANVSAKRCETVELQSVVGMFIRSVRQHPWIINYPDAPIVPIVECNNNEVFAASLVAVFKHYPPMWNPFTKDRFPRGVTDGVGVWTTEDTKAASLAVTYQLLLENRVMVAATLATADGTAYDARKKKADPGALLVLLAEQLETFTDNEDGKITGKIDGQNDDLGMAWLMAAYHRLAALTVDGSVES